MINIKTTYKWAYLPFVFSSAAILATQATAGPAGSQRYQDARQVNSVNHEYVGGKTQVGFGVTDDGDVDAELNQVISESDNHSTGVGLWAGYDLKGDDKGILGRGAQINHNWVSRDGSGRATRVNKVFAAYDRNEAGHDKATVGYGQENENLFWDAHVSKGLSGKKDTRTIGNRTVSDRAYDYGVGGTVGTFLPRSNTRVRAGLDHEWSDKVGTGEKDARNTTLSGGIEKFFQGTGHSLTADVAASKQSGGYLDGGVDDTDVSGRLGYRYDFGGASVYQPDRRYKRVRVEVPGKATAPRYAKKTQFKRVPTYKTVPVYGKKTVRTPYKQLVKSTMELEGQTFFKLNSSRLIPSAQTRLKQIAAQIRKSGYKGAIRITGNTCGLGDPVYDQRLSEKRANSVKAFLIKNGFNPNHLMARGLGKGHPKYPNTPDQGFKNRRVDIEYVSESNIYKTGYRTEQRSVQTGTRKVATGFKNVPAGTKNVLIDNGRPGTPRVIWKTEAIPTSPAWIKRALHNNIKHDRNVNTFTATDNVPTAPVNTGPLAVDDSATTSCSNPVAINVLANDSDVDGDALTVKSFTQPANGTLTHTSNGQFIYTPDGCGLDDQFTYVISDGNGGTDAATVVIINEGFVDNEVNATNDSAMTDQGQAVTIDVLANDDSDAEIKRIVTGPSGGSASIVNGQIVYTPNEDFTGTDTFVYEVRDPNGNIDTATVTVNVKALETENTAPTAVNDSTRAECGNPVIIDVLGNDTDLDGDALSVESFTQPANGTVARGSGGQLIYTSNGNGCGLDDQFTYTISDGNGGTNTATVTVSVDPKGDDNVNAANDSATTDQGQAVTIDVLSNDDADATIKRIKSAPSNGSASVVNGQIVYTPNAAFSGTDSFAYEVRDPNGNVAMAMVTVTVTPRPNLPPVAKDDSVLTGCSAITIDVLGNDSDPDGDALSLVSVSGASLGTAVVLGNSIVYTPSNTCSKGNTGTDSFSYTISDGNGNTASATVNVDVNGVKDGGNTNAEPDDVMTTMDQPVTINVLANDAGKGLKVVDVDMPKNGTAMIVGSTVKYTPAPGFIGTDSFWYEIMDANGNTDSALILVYVEKACAADMKCN